MENNYQFKVDYSYAWWNEVDEDEWYEYCLNDIADDPGFWMFGATDPEVDPNGTALDRNLRYQLDHNDFPGSAIVQLGDAVVQRIKAIAIKEYLGEGREFEEYFATLNLCFLNSAHEEDKPEIIKDYLENGTHGKLCSKFVEIYLAEFINYFGKKQDISIVDLYYVFTHSELSTAVRPSPSSENLCQKVEIQGLFEVGYDTTVPYNHYDKWLENSYKNGTIIDNGMTRVQLPDSLIQRIKTDAVKEYIAAHQG